MVYIKLGKTFSWTLTDLNSGCPMASSCSMAEKTRTISVMMTGQRKVMCTALILTSIFDEGLKVTDVECNLRRRTLKQRKTAA